MRPVPGICKITLILLIGATAAWAQPGPPRNEPTTFQTFYLRNAPRIQDASEILVAVRNIVTPATKLTIIPSQNALLVDGTSDQVTLVRKILDDIDRPQHTYRILYTLIDMDGAKRIGEQHYSMVVAPGQRTILKQGSRMPVVVNSPKNPTDSEITYLDVGMNFEATLSEVSGGVSLKSKLERSSIAEERSGIGPQDPIVRQSLVEGTAFLTPGKPLTIGSIDIPDSTRHLDVEVTMEPLTSDSSRKAVKP
ncbi:hypothetical protein JAO29_18460 [Edaphobacter sp. HDX4]|uniref:secretin N-terminal domain-containing protein n=1 Tax=Edaphobacter sp. HDX4 TaxID=2794064 RepID=UPI002FE645E8